VPLSPTDAIFLPAPDPLQYLPEYVEEIDKVLAEPWAASEEYRRVHIVTICRGEDKAHINTSTTVNKYRLNDIEMDALLHMYRNAGWVSRKGSDASLCFLRPGISYSNGTTAWFSSHTNTTTLETSASSLRSIS